MQSIIKIIHKKVKKVMLFQNKLTNFLLKMNHREKIKVFRIILNLKKNKKSFSKILANNLSKYKEVSANNFLLKAKYPLTNQTEYYVNLINHSKFINYLNINKIIIFYYYLFLLYIINRFLPF